MRVVLCGEGGFSMLMSLLSGGLTGILGSAIGKVFEFFQAREKAKERAADRAHEIRLLEMQAEKGAMEHERELAVEEAKTAASLRAASYAHDVAGGESEWVRNVLRLYRPAITTFLVGAVTAFFFFVGDEVRLNDLPVRAVIVESVLYAASTAVFWWFGDRGPSPKKRLS